ncbi:hypothetical protein SADUNF_Sadunf03G0063500 [Salix dunnii]|uniref:Zinc finger PHD-type domain-containing protein n=1 Tax=Salix dunnii TaxID=1413687 RepID=A0A835KA61_9ROSI|nr:hypothetical protein SADUNF_Sadunf03G0063500 [Salix dunnii]
MCFKTALTLKVGYPVQGPSDGKNHTFGLNMGSSVTENMFGSRQYSRDKFHIKEESGTCNECASTCSCCMAASLLRMKADVGFSYETSKGKVDIQYCHSGADMLSPVDSSCNSRNLSTSEISHLLSACSSHDSFSENEESKDTLRESGTFEHSEMQVAVNDQQTARQNPGLSRTTLFHDSNILLKNHQKPKELECFGDDASCISGSEYADKIAGDHHCYTERKNLSSSSTSIDSFPAIENAANVRPTLCSLARSQSDTIDNNQPRTLRESSPSIAVFSNKSNLIDISSARDFYIGANSSKEEPSECSEEKIESPLMKAATFWVDAQINDVENHAEPVKYETGRKDEEAAVAKCSDQKEEEPAKWQPTLKAQPMDLDDELDHMQDEVKVCDICGDVGQEEKLAVCSKCSDGAEHIYCMREKLEKVPEGNWMCEECMLGDENKRQKKNNFEKEEASRLEKSSLNEMIKKSKNSGALSCKISLESNTKGIGVYKNRRNDSSSCHFPAKRQVDDSEAFTVKRMALEKGHKSSMLSKESYTCSEEEICQGSSLINPAYEGSLSKSKSPHGINSKVELQQSEGGVNKQNLGRVTATCGNKEEVGRMPCKSTSFKKASSDHVTAADSKVKKISSNMVHVEKMKRLGRVKGQNLAVSETTFHKSMKKSTVADNHASASIRDIRTPHGGEASVLPLSTPTHHDLMAVQDDGKLSCSLTSIRDVAIREIPNEEQKRLLNDASNDEAFAARSNLNNLISTHPSNEPSYLKGLTWLPSAVDVPSWVSVVPQLECIWQGGFGIQRSGILISSCDGIQAHASSCASPKVHEIACKLPQKILAEQASCLVMWPTQPSESQAKEENIALYFFAKDLESYESNYRILLEYMTKNDLGLKANIDGLDLLIFSSKLLPKRSQRWNQMLFLWGVFRERKINCSQDIPNPQGTCFSELNVAHSGLQNLHSSAYANGILPPSNIFNNTQQTSDSVTSLEVPTQALARMGNNCENKGGSPPQKFLGFQTSDKWLSSYDTSMKSEKLSRNVKNNDPSQGQEKESEKGKQFDPNRERDIDMVTVEEECEGKRIKNFNGVLKHGTSGDFQILGDRLSSGVIDLSPVNIKPVPCQVDSMYGENPLESGNPNLELSLGFGKRLSDQGAVSVLPNAGHNRSKDTRDSNEVTSYKNNECSTTLTLSLASATSIEEKEAKKVMEPQLLFPTMDASLCLSL